jgi:hypothetical protein
MTDQRMNPDLIHDIPDILDRHGYACADEEHTSRAILLISDLAHIYEGAQDHPFSPYVNEAPPSETQPSPSKPQPRTPSPSQQTRSRPSWPRWTSPPTINATAPQPAPTAPPSPVPPASRVSRPVRQPTSDREAGQ